MHGVVVLPEPERESKHHENGGKDVSIVLLVLAHLPQVLIRLLNVLDRLNRVLLDYSHSNIAPLG